MSSDIDWKLNHLSLFFESLIGLHNLVPHTNNQTDFILFLMQNILSFGRRVHNVMVRTFNVSY